MMNADTLKHDEWKLLAYKLFDSNGQLVVDRLQVAEAFPEDRISFTLADSGDEELGNVLASLNKLLDDAVERASDEACAAIQDKLGITSGDFAGNYFSSPVVLLGMATDIAEYMKAELFSLAREHEAEVESARQGADCPRGQ